MHNFGSYAEKEIIMEKLMIILKENGYGKSTILKALNFALDGDYEDGMMKLGCSEMAVKITCENGLVIERQRRNGITTSKMGVGKTKTVPKEIANREIARLCNSSMEAIRVIASSKELFEMKPDVLALFLMSHLPNRMTVDDVIGYISDITPAMEQEVRLALPACGDFNQDVIQSVFQKFDEDRKNTAREVRNAKAKIMNFDFNQTMRPAGEIQEELNYILKQIGALDVLKRNHDNWIRLSKQRKECLDKLKKIQSERNAIKVIPFSPREEQALIKKEEEIREKIQECNNSLSTVKVTIKTVRDIIIALSKGTCPQIAGMKCPNDWSEKIKELEERCQQLTVAEQHNAQKLSEYNKELEKILLSKKRYADNFNNYQKVCNLDVQYKALRPTLIEVPEEPQISNEDYTEKKAALEDELRRSYLYHEMKKIKENIPLLENRQHILESLTKAFSKKGDVLQKSLGYYISFFENRLNEKAAELGYQIALKSENGLRVYIGKDGELTNIQNCSKGEKAIAIFLLLDMLNSITGIRLLFLDDVESLDTPTWTKLLELMSKYKDDYDHVILAGVNHQDMCLTMK